MAIAERFRKERQRRMRWKLKRWREREGTKDEINCEIQRTWPRDNKREKVRMKGRRQQK